MKRNETKGTSRTLQRFRPSIPHAGLRTVHIPVGEPLESEFFAVGRVELRGPVAIELASRVHTAACGAAGWHLLSPHILEASGLLKATLRSKEIELGDMKRELEASESNRRATCTVWKRRWRWFSKAKRGGLRASYKAQGTLASWSSSSLVADPTVGAANLGHFAGLGGLLDVLGRYKGENGLTGGSEGQIEEMGKQTETLDRTLFELSSEIARRRHVAQRGAYLGFWRATRPEGDSREVMEMLWLCGRTRPCSNVYGCWMVLRESRDGGEQGTKEIQDLTRHKEKALYEVCFSFFS
ncbi:hypothetical protein FA13DRAFT_1714886 [Coprinellus micaceus]|uniref:Uncharacterized protein n=1 Tax=Coprinellus micaceus TaxID=71717 RepID=A0A4Y7SQI8_COPMI|nr:hypothetical protein FA13DRAFT_1714886 [Coprinellus micaceus]